MRRPAVLLRPGRRGASRERGSRGGGLPRVGSGGGWGTGEADEGARGVLGPPPSGRRKLGLSEKGRGKRDAGSSGTESDTGVVFALVLPSAGSGRYGKSHLLWGFRLASRWPPTFPSGC